MTRFSLLENMMLVRCRFPRISQIIATIAALWFAGCKPADTSATPSTSPSVQTMRVQDAELEAQSFIGTYQTRRTIPLGPSQAGRIATIKVINGQYVHQGDVLITLENRLLLESVAQAQGEVNAARADAKQAASTLRRSKGLDVAGGISSGTLEERAALAETAQGKYRASLAALHQAQIQLAEADIRAPENGWVIGVSGVAGRLEDAGTEVLRLAAGEPDIHIKVPARAHLKVGDAAEVTDQSDQHAQFVHATVRELSPIDETSQMQDVYIRPDHSLPVPLGSLVTVALAPPVQPHAVRVPLTALISDDQNHAHLWSLTEDKTPQLVQTSVIIIGLRGADALVGGLKPQTQIVTSGADSLQAGEHVHISSITSER
ncbi:efflux RND transporter periplasmic adaptor subunit [Gluconobacter oxydans]|uniref:efflux RND transporter periplasmic adaptor subunit n=1 Tax=Gluconobacter oxydans TaxID=442 RepID=UPI000A4C1008|nr:efflux RND transporter periplasmic adaptor subunit [Gluconobacter oxydans]